MNDRKMVKTEIGKRELDNLRELLLHPDRDRLTPWEVVEIAADDLEEARAELVRVRQEADEARRGLEITDAELEGTRRRADKAEAELAAVRVRAERAEQERDEAKRLSYGFGQSTVDDLIAAVSHERVRADTAEAAVEDMRLRLTEVKQDRGRLRGVLQQVQAAIEPWLKFIEAAGDGPWEIEGVNEWPGRDAVRRLAGILSVSGSANPTLNSQETFQGSVLRANPKQEDGEPVKLSGVNLTFSEEALGDRP